ncbi:MAG: helix-turn-helix transcriptional regulator [Pseudomonadota bacterium]
MIVVNPARGEDRMVLRMESLSQVVAALGTPKFGSACFGVFAQLFDVDHWAVFRYRAGDTAHCISTASRVLQVAANRNIDAFQNHCFKVDPSLTAFRLQQPENPCLIKMEISDILDRQYRQCFEQTRVQERLSFFVNEGSDILHLSIFRTAANREFTCSDWNAFATVGRLLVASAVKHESLIDHAVPMSHGLQPDALERRFGNLDAGLSKREREVCARAVMGKSIDETALELDIRKTSVNTYRQRAYQKLSISRQCELVALVCEASMPTAAMKIGRNEGRAPSTRAAH